METLEALWLLVSENKRKNKFRIMIFKILKLCFNKKIMQLYKLEIGKKPEKISQLHYNAKRV